MSQVDPFVSSSTQADNAGAHSGQPYVFRSPTALGNGVKGVLAAFVLLTLAVLGVMVHGLQLLQQGIEGGITGALQDELADARSQVERLQLEAADAEARAQRAVAEAAVLRDEVRTSAEAASAAAGDASALREQLAGAEQQMRASAERYRDLVVRTEPALPAELIAGETIEDVDASVVAARDVVGRVRAHIVSQAQSARVPAGAPQRSAASVSSLSPEQKIRYGLGRRA